MMPTSAQCLLCGHFASDGDERGLFECTAYPAGIPFVIISGEHDHREPFKGDNGIRFKPLDLKEARNP